MSCRISSDATDTQVVSASLDNLDCFSILVERYEVKLTYYILRISNFSKQEAEEVLQEVFISVWKNLRSYDDSYSFSSWIYRIARNKTISSFRATKSRGYDKQIDLDAVAFSIPDSKKGAHDLLFESHTADVVKEVLQKLPQKYRDVLVLFYYEDQSYAEISAIMHKPSGTVATLLNRAKKRFKKILLEYEIN